MEASWGIRGPQPELQLGRLRLRAGLRDILAEELRLPEGLRTGAEADPLEDLRGLRLPAERPTWR